MASLLICLMLLHAATLNEVAANVFLTSDMQSGRRFACDGDLVTFTCEVFGSASLQWRNPRISSIIFLSSLTAPVVRNVQPFVATLTSRVGSGFSANFTSTLQVTASRMISQSDTIVECRNQQQVSEEGNFTATDIPDPPASFTLDDVTRAPGSVTITASWIKSPNFEQFDIDRYDINVSSTSGIQEMITASGGMTRINFTASENSSNVEQSTIITLTIAAVNLCGETGSVATASYIPATLTSTTTLATPTASSTQAPPTRPPQGINGSLIGGIVGGVGGLLVVSAILIIAILIYLCCCKREKHLEKVELEDRP